MKILSVLYCLLILNLILLAWEDWRHRSVKLLSLCFLGALSLGIAYFQSASTGFLFNISFVLIQMSILIVVFSIRQQRINWMIGGSIGWGDILFIILSTIWMPGHFFLISYMLGLIGTLLIVVVRVNKDEIASFSIPLVTGLAIAQILSLPFI